MTVLVSEAIEVLVVAVGLHHLLNIVLWLVVLGGQVPVLDARGTGHEVTIVLLHWSGAHVESTKLRDLT